LTTILRVATYSVCVKQRSYLAQYCRGGGGGRGRQGGRQGGKEKEREKERGRDGGTERERCKAERLTLAQSRKWSEIRLRVTHASLHGVRFG
jgi:hypothetical protein